ncbi:class I SAM-dependent DNA methyltransferase [Comamonas composti]|uniref:class I SAM-dependent DNA methyltransferase n=1 Tax=Comamonas composti TaxID=408558 RepID=UPI0003FBA11C|nr:N-6 DNA methylase [Comamonas composti]
MTPSDIVQKLWGLCDVLRDDGINYSDYVTELVLLLYIKMEHESVHVRERHRLPEEARWPELTQRSGMVLLTHYQDVLTMLSRSSDPRIAAIYAGAQTRLKEPRHLAQLIASLDAIDWFSADKDGLGDLYEGLLEKNAGETKSGAGQYFTPRPLIDAMVAVMQPEKGETVQDPAAGTAGFLIAADRYIRNRTDNLYELPDADRQFQRSKAFVGMELVANTRRLALMNCLLHGMEGEGEGAVRLGNTLAEAGKRLPLSDLMLSNPPFGTAKGGGGPTRDDFTFETSNKQLAFVQHIVAHLKDGGRAAVVLPDNVLFESGVGTEIRRDLMHKCRLHTILRLPTGIFYAQGVKTNVLFFEKVGKAATDSTQEVWVYDMRTNAPKFGKRTPLTAAHFAEFISAYGEDHNGRSPRTDTGEQGRFRCFGREWIAKEKADSLDIAWLKDDGVEDAADLPEPAVLAREAVEELNAAVAELEGILRELGE